VATKFKPVTMSPTRGRVGRAVDAVKRFFGFGKTKAFLPKSSPAKKSSGGKGKG
jgi:hypothetical protein